MYNLEIRNELFQHNLENFKVEVTALHSDHCKQNLFDVWRKHQIGQRMKNADF